MKTRLVSQKTDKSDESLIAKKKTDDAERAESEICSKEIPGTWRETSSVDVESKIEITQDREYASEYVEIVHKAVPKESNRLLMPEKREKCIPIDIVKRHQFR